MVYAENCGDPSKVILNIKFTFSQNVNLLKWISWHLWKSGGLYLYLSCQRLWVRVCSVATSVWQKIPSHICMHMQKTERASEALVQIIWQLLKIQWGSPQFTAIPLVTIWNYNTEKNDSLPDLSQLEPLIKNAWDLHNGHVTHSTTTVIHLTTHGKKGCVIVGNSLNNLSCLTPIRLRKV